MTTRRRTRRSRALAVSLAIAAGAAVSPLALAQPAAASGDHGKDHGHSRTTTVYTQTNAATGNRVLAFRDDGAGPLRRVGSYATGGLGSGDSLGSQGAVALSEDASLLLAVNAGSDSVTAFAVRDDGSLRRVGRARTGDRPVSVTAHGGTAYVVDAGSLDITGFRLGRWGITRLPDSTRQLSEGAAAPAQVGFSPDGRHLVVTEKASNTLDVFRVRRDGRTGPPQTTGATGTTPFGFAFTPRGILVVSEAASASAATFALPRRGAAVPLDEESNGGQGAPCWVVVTEDGRYAFTANAAASANSISSYRVARDGQLTLVAARATATAPHPTDMAISGRQLYSLSDQGGQIQESRIDRHGGLSDTTSVVTGLPTTVSGLAALGR